MAWYWERRRHIGSFNRFRIELSVLWQNIAAFPKENLEKLMMNTSMLSKDLGTVLVGEDAVTAGLVNEVGGIDKAYQKLRGLMNK